MTYEVRKSAETTKAAIIAVLWSRTRPLRIDRYPNTRRTADVALSDALSRGRSDSVKAGTVRRGSGAARDHQDPQHRQVDDGPEEQALRVLHVARPGEPHR